MTHFAVLLVLPEPPTTPVIERTLAPWREYSGKSFDPAYVVEVDITDEALQNAATSTETRMRDTYGGLHDPFDGQGGLKPAFTRYDTERGRDVLHTPEGFETIEVPLSDLGIDVADWISEYYGYGLLRIGKMPDPERHTYGRVVVGPDNQVVRVIKRTNPNGKWDWWQLGGRYTGRFEPGYDPEKDPENQETCFLCGGSGFRDDEAAAAHRERDPGYSCNGCTGKGRSPKWPTQWANVGNVSRWGDVDLAALKAAQVAERRAIVEEIMVKAGFDFDLMEKAQCARSLAHEVWRGLDGPRPRGGEYFDWLRTTQPDGELAARLREADIWDTVDPPHGMTIADWIEEAPALSAYAFVKDGEWVTRGDVGWFGVTTGDRDDWQARFDQMLASIPADHYVAIVDCHT